MGTWGQQPRAGPWSPGRFQGTQVRNGATEYGVAESEQVRKGSQRAGRWQQLQERCQVPIRMKKLFTGEWHHPAQVVAKAQWVARVSTEWEDHGIGSESAARGSSPGGRRHRVTVKATRQVRKASTWEKVVVASPARHGSPCSVREGRWVNIGDRRLVG